MFHIRGRSLPFRRVAPDTMEIEGKLHRFYVIDEGDSCTVWLNGRTYHLERAARGHAAHTTAASAGGNVIALMPGKLVRLDVAVGDAVTEQQTVAIMESMKMESALHSPKSGRVLEIRCRPGQNVEMGELLIVIE